MPHKTHLVIAIPAYNEEKVIKKVIEQLPRQIKGVGRISVFVINDGSTDNTANEVEKTRALLVNLPVNLGYGGASIAALEASKALKADVAVTFDGDGQHSPSDIPHLIEPILKGRADLVIGTRFKKSRTVPKVKKIGIRIMNFITFILSGYLPGDSQCGLKAFSRKALDKMELNLSGMEFASETIIEAQRQHLKIVEVPVKIIYTSYSQRKGQSILNGINILIKLIVKTLAG